MERKLDVGGILKQIFETYGAQAGVLLPVAFCLYLVVAVVTALLAGSLALFPLAFAVGVVAATLYQGMVVGLVKDVQDGRRDSSSASATRATHLGGPTAATSSRPASGRLNRGPFAVVQLGQCTIPSGRRRMRSAGWWRSVPALSR